MSAKPIPTDTHNANTIRRFMSFSSTSQISARLSWLHGNIYPPASECNFPAQFHLQIFRLAIARGRR
jgi:hypothetical protein